MLPLKPQKYGESRPHPRICNACTRFPPVPRFACPQSRTPAQAACVRSDSPPPAATQRLCCGALLRTSPTASMSPRPEHSATPPRCTRVARPLWASRRVPLTASPAPPPATPIAPSSVLELTQRAAQRRMGLCLLDPPPRASRGRPGPQSGRSLSLPRLRRRRAHRAQLLPGPAPESVSMGLQAPPPSAARARSPRFRSRVARGLRHLAFAVRLSNSHLIALTHRPKARSHHNIRSGEGGRRALRYAPFANYTPPCVLASSA